MLQRGLHFLTCKSDDLFYGNHFGYFCQLWTNRPKNLLWWKSRWRDLKWSVHWEHNPNCGDRSVRTAQELYDIKMLYAIFFILLALFLLVLLLLQMWRKNELCHWYGQISFNWPLSQNFQIPECVVWVCCRTSSDLWTTVQEKKISLLPYLWFIFLLIPNIPKHLFNNYVLNANIKTDTFCFLL